MYTVFQVNLTGTESEKMQCAHNRSLQASNRVFALPQHSSSTPLFGLNIKREVIGLEQALNTLSNFGRKILSDHRVKEQLQRGAGGGQSEAMRFDPKMKTFMIAPEMHP